MKPSTEPTPQSGTKKPRLALFIATGFGLGYLPLVPGTWGSLLGLAVSWWALRAAGSVDIFVHNVYFVVAPAHFFLSLLFVLSAIGVWAADRAEKYIGSKDPQIVVIDEASGQIVALVPVLLRGVTNWKYLVLGFILFRVFDIWKPFPVRQAERLPGGWGIMADDWLAGIYAALGLWLARALGL